MKAPRNHASTGAVIPDDKDAKSSRSEMDTWPCPGLSPHPAPEADSQMSFFEWTMDKPSKSRTLKYTCSCQRVVYEFLATSGNYRICRKDRTAPAWATTYAGPWRRQVAERMWALILTGEVSLCSGPRLAAGVQAA
jgi:hypothetical protein